MLVPVADAGLGNTSHGVDLGDVSALVVDPERDPRAYSEAGGQIGPTVRHVAETHLHVHSSVFDVRQRSECESGHVDGAMHVAFARLLRKHGATSIAVTAAGPAEITALAGR